MNSQEFRLLQQIYVLADDREHDAAQKKLKEEQDRDRWLREMRKAFEPLFSDDSPAIVLRREANERFPDDSKKARTWWRKKALQDPEISKFVNRADRLKRNAKTILARIEAVAFGDQARRKSWEALQRTLMNIYRDARQQQAQKQLQQRLPEAFAASLFAKSFGVDVSPDGKLINEFQLFGTKVKTIESKRKAMLTIVKNWNKLVERVNEDLSSSDPAQRLKAIIVSILMSTGIRVGEGKSKIRDHLGRIILDEQMEPVRVDTFGATSLQPEHIDFVRDNFAQISFLGKGAKRNVVDLSDAQLITALREQIAAVAENRDAKYLFVLPSGNRISDKVVNRYIQSIVGKEVTAHNFRHLKSIETFFTQLRQQQEDLSEKLRELKGLAKKEMIEKTSDIVLAHLQNALEQTQQKLHHKDVATTIESYLHPRAILEYLSNAGMDRALEVVLGDGHGIVVRFDPEDFYEKVVGSPMTTAAKGGSGTMFYYGDRFVDYDIDDAIEELEEESSKS